MDLTNPQQGTGSPFQKLYDLPAYSWTDWDNLNLVKGAIAALENGQFDQASLLVDQMMRDDRIGGCLDMRTTALSYMPTTFEDGEGEKAEAFREMVEANFERIIPDEASTEHQKWGLMLGLGVAENVYERDEETGVLLCRLKVWHPRSVMWRWDLMSFTVQTKEGMEVIKPNDGRWVLYAPFGLQRAWMNGLVRRLYVPWLLRQWAMRDSGRYSETYGSPIKKLKVPANKNDQNMKAFLSQVANLGSDSTIKVPQTADGQGYDLELIEAMGTGFAGFNSIVDLQSTNIAIAILGQNLTTEVKGGSYAAAEVHASIKNSLLQGDADKYSTTIYEGTLKPLARFNVGDPLAAPYLSWNTEPPEEKKASADTLNTLGDAIGKLREFFPLDVEALARRFDIPIAEGADDVIEQKEAAPPPLAVAPGAKVMPFQKKASLSVSSQLVAAQERLDGLVESSSAEGTVLTALELSRLASVIQGANDFEELRRGILGAFSGITDERLTALLTQALMLAELEGRDAAMEAD